MKRRSRKSQEYGAITAKYTKGSPEGDAVEWFKEHEPNISRVIRNFIYIRYCYKATNLSEDPKEYKELLFKALRYVAAEKAEIEAMLKYCSSEPESPIRNKTSSRTSIKEKKSTSLIKEDPFTQSFKL